MVLASFVAFDLVSRPHLSGLGNQLLAVDKSPAYLYGDIPGHAWDHILPEIANKFGLT